AVFGVQPEIATIGACLGKHIQRGRRLSRPGGVELCNGFDQLLHSNKDRRSRSRCTFAVMTPASLSDIKSALKNYEAKELAELVLRLARYKKENKELLSFLIYHGDNLPAYLQE